MSEEQQPRAIIEYRRTRDRGETWETVRKVFTGLHQVSIDICEGQPTMVQFLASDVVEEQIL